MNAQLKSLLTRSMLFQAKALAKKHQDQPKMMRPYSQTQSHQLSAEASVWLDLYPAAILTHPGESVLSALCDPSVWRLWTELGIKVIHTNPLRLSGGISRAGLPVPSVDTGYDRIDFSIDPQFGDEADYQHLIALANHHDILIADDIIPCHTGKGADFRLAELNYEDYPGLYVMTTIAPEDWVHLPEIPKGEDSVNLDAATEALLASKGYIIGALPEVIFYQPPVKETNWSVTAPITGVDGITRRWVYLHLFKIGQPTLNWLDPSFAAQRLILGDLLKTRLELGATIVRLDANAHLAVEKYADGRLTNRGHPLAQSNSQIISMFMRQMGGWTFQENNAAVDALAKSASFGPDLSYDFLTRSGYIHALLTGNAALLRLQQQLMHHYGIDPRTLIHGLQNHDCFNYELAHFIAHPNESFSYADQTMTGQEIMTHVLSEADACAKRAKLPFSMAFCGLSATLASLAAARLGVPHPEHATPQEREKIIKLMLLAAFYNAMQPGIFQLSGWDMVGACNLKPEAIPANESDIRWLQRGAYDLSYQRKAANAPSGMPSAPILFNTVTDNVFITELKALLQLRASCRIAEAEVIAPLIGHHAGTSAMLYRLPDQNVSLVVLNFANEAVSETFCFENQEQVLSIPAFSGRMVQLAV